jgi:hypothetical protein
MAARRMNLIVSDAPGLMEITLLALVYLEGPLY